MAFAIGYFQDVISLSDVKSLSYFSFLDKSIFYLIELLDTICVILIFSKLSKLFSSYKEKKYFDVNTIKLIKTIAGLMLLAELIHPIYQVLITYALTFYNESGHHLISIGVGGSSFTSIITGIILYIAAYIMEEARRLQQLQELTV